MKTETRYTIPRNNRELQRGAHCIVNIHCYTIPRNNRELQHRVVKRLVHYRYTIPRNNRELQPKKHSGQDVLVIPYQEIIGNYNAF